MPFRQAALRSSISDTRCNLTLLVTANMNVAALLQDAPSSQRAPPPAPTPVAQPHLNRHSPEPGEVIAPPSVGRNTPSLLSGPISLLELPRERREREREREHEREQQQQERDRARERERDQRDQRERDNRERERELERLVREPPFRDTLPPPPPRDSIPRREPPQGWDHRLQVSKLWDAPTPPLQDKDEMFGREPLARGEPLTERDRRPRGWMPQPPPPPTGQVPWYSQQSNPTSSSNNMPQRPAIPSKNVLKASPPRPVSRHLRPSVTRRLGTYVYPELPFPFTPSPHEARVVTPSDVFETLADILIPASFIPSTSEWTYGLLSNPVPATQHRNKYSLDSMDIDNTTTLSTSIPPPLHSRPRIWGGGLPASRTVSSRRVYTDDSDLYLCAIHAGMLRPMSHSVATAPDVRITVRLISVAAHMPPPGHELVGRFLAGVGQGEFGRQLQSSAWGANHDGGAFEIIDARWTPASTAVGARRAFRKRRMREYAERRIMKKDLSLGGIVDGDGMVNLKVRWGNDGIMLL
ncbi:hypothetical protein CYLTODRAFT_490642 [Cylindrobasidium torrendii FP15055 ss-10]|uniref:Rxt3-domain-containing protein n=1 Tax=Cylindrobasidium torrendii FP15055 ss-10 TaxID=1314674 RepID=A0A0D7BA70_9AGAR|nr:hypothetical protein CYLTODRAFT_490642 [Cylindrobasidium torrendii FP15055 ss-10]